MLAPRSALRQMYDVRYAGLAIVIGLGLAACGSDRLSLPTAPPAPAAPAVDPFAPIPAEPQRAGDPKRGWDALTGAAYVGCGVPRSLLARFVGARAFPDAVRLERTRGAELPYFLNPGTTAAGVEIVTASCLGCHAAWLQGKLVVGLGEQSADFTIDLDGPLAVASLLVEGAERDELRKLAARVRAVGPYAKSRTIGANPADHIAAALFAHRDPATLAWSDEPLIPLPDLAAAPVIPVDVPAWWLLKKKTAMFHNGAGRGDHARIMMAASMLCVDDVETARTIDAMFPDIRAFVLSIEAPAYPGPIDPDRAAHGRAVFEATCAKCHGTYGPDGRYQSRVVPLAKIGTDPRLAEASAHFAAPYTAWFKRSFYGELARLEPAAGYVAPPLDGVWATAPYLHNGSVPNLAALLDSRLRRARTYLDRRSFEYDLRNVGWPNEDAAAWPGARPEEIYDTAVPGYANTGHTFGDRLTPAERAAVIEYLKTL